LPKTNPDTPAADYFDRIKQAFYAYCEKVRVETHQKLDAVGDDKEAQKKILAEEKAVLDKAFGELKGIVDTHNRTMREQREKGVKKAEDKDMRELEKEIQNL